MTKKTYVATIQENPNPELNTYRIWHGDNTDRSEIGRVSAKNIDEATEYAIKQYLKEGTEYEEDGDDTHTYLMIDICSDCPNNEENMNFQEDCDRLCKDCENYACPDNENHEDDPCMYCELSEYLEIETDNEAETEYRTIFGINEYGNTHTGEQPYEYDPLLAKAWEMDSQLGADMLMMRTIEQNPELFSAIDREYLKRLYETKEKMTEKGG